MGKSNLIGRNYKIRLKSKISLENFKVIKVASIEVIED